MKHRFLRSPSFWIPFVVTLAFTSLFFVWELGYVNRMLPSLPRPAAGTTDVAFTVVLGLLLSINAGLAVWQKRYGHCPRGVKRASSFAGLLGAVTLICPVCLLLPASLIGIGFVFTFLTPFLPLLRIVAVILLGVSGWMLRPKNA